MFPFLLICLALFGCGSSMGNIPENCEIRHDGVCYMQQSEACEAAGCPDHCIILETYPGQVECTEPAPSTNAPDGDGIPEDCGFRVGDACFATSEEACAASECPPDRCSILESYPAQIQCAAE